jgi:hypothetical protein
LLRALISFSRVALSCFTNSRVAGLRTPSHPIVDLIAFSRERDGCDSGLRLPGKLLFPRDG